MANYSLLKFNIILQLLLHLNNKLVYQENKPFVILAQGLDSQGLNNAKYTRNARKGDFTDLIDLDENSNPCGYFLVDCDIRTRSDRSYCFHIELFYLATNSQGLESLTKPKSAYCVRIKVKLTLP